MNRSIVGMLLGTFVLRVSTSITGLMLAFYLADLHYTSNGVAILHLGFYVTELVGAIGFGILADVVGRKLIMLIGPAFGGIAVFLTGLTTVFPLLFVTRLLEGGSTAASVPSTLGFIAVETSHDDRLRGRVVSWFELLSLAGMLAIGPALGGILYEHFGRGAFFINVGIYLVAFLFYAYGVREAPRLRQEAASASGAPRNAGRYLAILTNRRVLLFAPTWLAINAVLGLWVSQAPFLLKGGGGAHPGQYLLTLHLTSSQIGVGEAILACFLGAGILFWGGLFGRLRRTTMLLMGVGAFIVAAIDVFLVNRFGGTSVVALAAMVALLLVALFVLSGATPAALGMLADVSEGFHEDRSAIMGFYSVFMGVGQVIGISLAGPFAEWRGIDGLLIATAGLLVVGLVALLNLRAHEHESGHAEAAADRSEGAEAAAGGLQSVVARGLGGRSGATPPTPAKEER